jgi:hypothetical protein
MGLKADLGRFGRSRPSSARHGNRRWQSRFRHHQGGLRPATSRLPEGGDRTRTEPCPSRTADRQLGWRPPAGSIKTIARHRRPQARRGPGRGLRPRHAPRRRGAPFVARPGRGRHEAVGRQSGIRALRGFKESLGPSWLPEVAMLCRHVNYATLALGRLWPAMPMPAGEPSAQRQPSKGFGTLNVRFDDCYTARPRGRFWPRPALLNTRDEFLLKEHADPGTP